MLALSTHMLAFGPASVSRRIIWIFDFSSEIQRLGFYVFIGCIRQILFIYFVATGRGENYNGVCEEVIVSIHCISVISVISRSPLFPTPIKSPLFIFSA